MLENITDNLTMDINSLWTETKFLFGNICFKATLDINNRVINTVIIKLNYSGTVSIDMREKHEKHGKVDDSIQSDIRAHIGIHTNNRKSLFTQKRPGKNSSIVVKQ